MSFQPYLLTSLSSSWPQFGEWLYTKKSLLVGLGEGQQDTTKGYFIHLDDKGNGGRFNFNPIAPNL